jgi:hypothetical protein
MYVDVEPREPLELKDLFRLLMGTVHIPLSPVTIQLIQSTGLMDEADLVLIGRQPFKMALWNDDTWCKILIDLASVIERDEDTQITLEQICTSVEGYTRQKLDEELEDLKQVEIHTQVYAAVTLATHREQQHVSPDNPVPETKTLTLNSLMHRMLEF